MRTEKASGMWPYALKSAASLVAGLRRGAFNISHLWCHGPMMRTMCSAQMPSNPVYGHDLLHLSVMPERDRCPVHETGLIDHREQGTIRSRPL